MNGKRKNNWLHLDLKGAIPSVGKLLEQLEFWKDCGYDGIVWEYDDRIPWQSWPGTWRGGYTIQEQRRLMDACRKLELETVPLIQIQGHLEWLLKHERYSGWRENGVSSELCPLHPEVLPRLKKWIDEITTLHPGSRFLHLGADETWYMGKCGKCSLHDKMELYGEHVSRLCNYVLEKGWRPLIWADMFWREKRLDVAARLPVGTILVDWQYDGAPPYETTEALLECGHEVMGASGVMTGWWEHCYRVQSEPESRVRNVSAWNRWAMEKNIGMIHTTWTRGASLWNIYGPWHGALPAFIAGGNPERWERHPWHGFMERLARIMEQDVPDELDRAATEMLELPADGSIEVESRRWWNLALRYQSLQKQLLIHRSTRTCLEQVGKFVGRDKTMFHRNCILPFAELLPKAEQWEEEARAFWRDNELSDTEEFMATHIGIMINEIKYYLNTKTEVPFL